MALARILIALISIVCCNLILVSGTNGSERATFSCGQGSYTIQISDGKVLDGKNCVGGLILDSSARIIGTEAFLNSAISYVTIPPSVERIESRAFEGTKSLFHLQLPDSLKTIESRAFANSGLFTVGLGNSVIRIGDGAFGGNRLTSLVIPDSVLELGEWAFAANSIYSLTLGKGLRVIGPGAFEENRISRVSIPEEVSEVGKAAFWSQVDLGTNKRIWPIEVIYCGSSQKTREQLQKSQNSRLGSYWDGPTPRCPRLEAAAEAEAKRIADAEFKRAAEEEDKRAAELEARKNATKKTTITCIKGKTVKKVTAIKPKCPTGFKKK